jgi:hypothetical protein
MYDEQFATSSFTPNEYAKRVGLPPIEPAMQTLLKRTVLGNIKREMSA